MTVDEMLKEFEDDTLRKLIRQHRLTSADLSLRAKTDRIEDAILRRVAELTTEILRRHTTQHEDSSPVYDPTFGDTRLCECGHAYRRHFDTYDGMAPVGCKYCLPEPRGTGKYCSGFKLKEGS